MRMTDTLSRFTVDPKDYKTNDHLKVYVPAIEAISGSTGIPANNWEVYEDGHQISTREAGKSSCAFLGAKFGTLAQAFGVITALQKDFPTVNVELFVAPDGRRDQGYGVASYDHLGILNQENSRYIQQQGFGVSVLVDAQNVNRHLSAKQAFQKSFQPSKPGA